MTRHRLIGLGLIVLFGVLPLLIGSRYAITQITLFFIWAAVVTQWNLVFGVAGIFSLAQMAIFAVGAYTTAMLAFYAGWSIWAAMPAAALASAGFSILIGIACLRLKGAYVALLTFAVALAMQLLIITDVDCFKTDGTVCLQLTGGVKGFSRFGDFGFRDLLGAANWHIGNYYVALVLLVLATVFSQFIIASPLGLAFRAMRDNVGYATARGVNRFGAQILVFALSAVVTGLAGAVYAGHFRVVGPHLLNLPLLTFLVAMMVVGGLGGAWGPLVGAMLLMASDEALKEVTDYRNIGIGLVLIVSVVLLPEGVTGLISRLHGAWLNRRARQ